MTDLGVRAGEAGKNIDKRYDVHVEDVAYQRIDGEPLLARVYAPVGHGPFPGVVEVHGGSWTTGDRLNNRIIDEALAAAGIVVMAVDFRMPPRARYPDPVADIHLAVRWLKAHGGRYGVRPECVGGIGTSSGGHQLLLNALRPFDPRYAALPLRSNGPSAPLPDATLRFVAVCWPVVDPLARYRMAQARSIERFLAAHAAYWPDEAAMEEGNPQLILERGEAIEMPPTLIVQGTRDDNLTPDMADRFAAAYRRRGGEITLAKFDGEPHMFVTRAPQSANSQAALAMLKDFVREHAR